jgi:hypothetical protein
MTVCYTCEPPSAGERTPLAQALAPRVLGRDTQAHVGVVDTMTPTTAQERVSDVLVVHASYPMRTMLRTMLADEGYAASATPNYPPVLRYLQTAAEPAVVVAGNSTADFQAEEEFFGHIAADATLARRNRFVLLCTVPERLPADLQATLNSLGVPILHMPSQLPELVKVAARVAERAPADGGGESEAETAG